MSETAPLVLLVDDDPVIVRLLEVNFRLAGFRTEAASRGDVVVERAQALSPDAIVLDVTLPGLDGLEAARRLRADPRQAGVPVVFLTARADDGRQSRAADLGPADWVEKPFDPAELVSIVERRLAERASP